MIGRNRQLNLNDGKNTVNDLHPQFLLPVDLLPIILSYYTNSFQGLFLFSLICRSWKTVADHSRIWKECELSFKLETWNRSLQRELSPGIRIHQISLNDSLDSIHYRIDVDYVMLIRPPLQAIPLLSPITSAVEAPLEPSQIRHQFLSILITYKKLYQYYSFIFRLFQVCHWCKEKHYHLPLALTGLTFLITAMFVFSWVPDCFDRYWLNNLLYLFLELGCIFCLFFVLVEEFHYRARRYRYYEDFKKNMIDILILTFFFIYSFLGIIVVIFMFIINLLIHLL